MKIEAHRIADRYSFFCICDYCEKPIEDAEMAMFAWSDPAGFFEDSKKEAKTFHKIPCLRRWSEVEKVGGRRIMTQELVHGLIYIGNGMKLNWQYAHQHAGTFEDDGIVG